MMYIKEFSLQSFTGFLIKKILLVLLKVKLYQTKNWLKNYTNELLDNLKNEKCTHFDMQLIRKFNKGFRLLLCVIDVYNKYEWVAPLKDKTGITTTSFSSKISYIR